MSDAAIASIVTGVVSVVLSAIGFLTLWVKLKYGADQAEQAKQKAQAVEGKIDLSLEKIEVNTKVTKAGIKVAARDNKEAVVAAVDAKGATEAMAATVSKKLNGGIDDAVEKNVGPIKARLEEMAGEIADLKAYQHESKHDLRNMVNNLHLNQKLMLEILRLEFPHRWPARQGETKTGE